MQAPASSAWLKSGVATLSVAVIGIGCSNSEPSTTVPLASGGAIGNGGQNNTQPGNGGAQIGVGGNGSSTGGSGTTATTGGSTNAGGSSSSTGGSADVGGSTSGGATTGGTSSASNTGGTSNIGGAIATGGSTSGGSSSGGASTGGSTGTNATGGVTNTGGSPSGIGGSGLLSCDVVICTGGKICVSGVCQCPTDTTLCGGVCLAAADLQSDPAHCGTTGCGVACATGATCSAGVCSCTTAGLTGCSGTCVDMQTDPKNCGKCGTACASGICEAGVCRKVKDCYQKIVVGSPLVADFEGYDGTTPITNWGWAFNAAAGADNAVYAGLYEYNDGTGAPALSMPAPGYNSSKYAASVSNTQASTWGGALGMWMGCIDASAYQGISFWVQGTIPTGKVAMTMTTEATTAPDATGYGGGSCTSGTCKPPSIEFPVTTSWTQVLVPWSTFTAGTANGATVTTTGADVTGLAYNVSLNYVSDGAGGWVASPGAYSFVVDDIQLIGSTACTSGLTICGTGCVNTQTNPVHCGACNNACGATRSCVAGACICPSGYTDCSGECVNTQIDVQNCGGCGKPCTGICSAGGCQASTCTSGMSQIGYTRTAYASIVQNKYWINNNVWGTSGATGWQGIWSTCTSGNTIGWGTDWSWSGATNHVKSYASAVLGWHWGWKVSSGTGLPVQLSANKNVTCGWTYRVEPGQTIDVAYDLFAHGSSNPGTNDNPTDEIMIWLYRSGGAAPIGGVESTTSIGGASWEVHRGNNGNWNVYSYVRTDNTTSATLNLMDFLKDLVNKGWMSSSKYLTSVQAGTEVFLGTGRLDTDQYYCTIQ